MDLRVRLYTSSPVLDHTLVIGSLTEPTFTGYTEFSSSAWSIPAPDVADDVFILSPVVIFNGPPGGPPGDICNGYFVTIEDGASTLLWYVEAFPSPLPLVQPTDQISFRVQLKRRSLAA